MSGESLTNKAAQTHYPLHPLLRDRWSPRAFADRPVEREKLGALVEAARWSASGGNLQPWAFILAQRFDQPEVFALLASCLGEGNVGWAAKAPVLGISVASLYRRPEVANRHAWHDVGLATQNLVIQATALELYVHLMGGFSPDKARELFAIPAEYEAVTMFALGYLGDPATLNEREREREVGERSRRPLTEFIFGERWGVSALFLDQA